MILLGLLGCSSKACLVGSKMEVPLETQWNDKPNLFLNAVSEGLGCCAVANQETCEQPHFVDWALWEHGCAYERNVCLDQVNFAVGHHCSWLMVTLYALPLPL